MENLQELLAISQIAANAHSVIAKFDSQSDLCLRLESLSKKWTCALEELQVGLAVMVMMLVLFADC